jgi:hypothetical protein
LKKNGVSVVSATEPIDDSPEGQLMESIFEGFSVYYIKDLSAKVNRGMTENALKCKFNGGNPTYGYIIDEHKHFQPDPVKALIVADIFRRYSGGESIKSILASLNEQELLTNHGKPPTYSFIVNLIKNRRYLGEYRFKDTVVDDAFTPLIDLDTFERCQRRLSENQRRPASFKPVEDKYLLTGRIFCGYCGVTMCGESGKSKTGVVHRYYHCHAAKTKRTCDKKRVGKSLIESTVIDFILRALDDAPLLNRIVDACYDIQIKKNTVLPSLEQQLARTQKEIDNVMTAIKQGIITPTTKDTLLQLEQAKEEQEIGIAKARMERPVFTKEQIKFWLCKFRLTDPNDTNQRQQLINTYLHGIHIYDDKMLVVLNYKDGEICVTFDEIQDALKHKENSGNRNDCHSSPLSVVGDPPSNASEPIPGAALPRLALTWSRVTVFSPSLWLNRIMTSVS